VLAFVEAIRQHGLSLRISGVAARRHRFLLLNSASIRVPTSGWQAWKRGVLFRVFFEILG
jgi:hypothetical protein